MTTATATPPKARRRKRLAATPSTQAADLVRAVDLQVLRDHGLETVADCLQARNLFPERWTQILEDLTAQGGGRLVEAMDAVQAGRQPPADPPAAPDEPDLSRSFVAALADATALERAAEDALAALQAELASAKTTLRNARTETQRLARGGPAALQQQAMLPL